MTPGIDKKSIPVGRDESGKQQVFFTIDLDKVLRNLYPLPICGFRG